MFEFKSYQHIAVFGCVALKFQGSMATVFVFVKMHSHSAQIRRIQKSESLGQHNTHNYRNCYVFLESHISNTTGASFLQQR